MKILVVEDEKEIQKIIKLYLENDGFTVLLADNGEQGLTILYENKIDLTIVDWMMPKMNGIDFCKEVRKQNIPTKLIMLTAKSEHEDEVLGLTYGADDYIKKPFEPKILLLRIKKLLQLDDVCTCGTIAQNNKTHVVTLQDEVIKLTKIEYHLLRELLIHKNQILSREFLLNHVWGMDYFGDTRTLDTHIRRLRKKLGDQYISTHVGIGYSLEATT